MLNVCPICVYLPPSDSNYAYTIDDLVRLFNFIQCQQKKFDELVIYGDFNFSSINWKTMSSEKSLATTFLSLMEKNNLLQLITFNTSATGILDLILVTKGVSAVTLEILPNYESLFNVSNHFPILFTFSLQCPNWQRTSPCDDIVYSFCNADFDRFKEHIEINPFNSYCWSNVDILVDQWYKWLEKIIKQTVPQRTKHRCMLPPWISKETSHLIKCLQTKRRRYKESHPSVQSALLNVKKFRRRG